MAISDLQLNNFQELFIGNTSSYGQHYYKFTRDKKKEAGGNKTVTNTLLTLAQYSDHLDGIVGLGIVPINSDNKCKFVVIDIDVYDKDFTPYLDAIERHNIPIVPFRSKSGGYHLYIFFKQFIRAKEAVDIANKLARILGITLFVKNNKNESVEIFPKQMKLNPGETGNWINLPYYNAADTRQGVLKNGSVLSFDAALIEIKGRVTTIAEIEEAIDDLPFNDAPPCLQTLYLLNMLNENSGRNNYLFSFGVYLKKKDENYFEQKLAEINDSLTNPLEIKEIEATIFSSLRKKDYTYKCTASPCLDFCDKKVCQKKTYGIGSSDGFFTNLIFGDMIQYQAASPYYEWEVKVKESDRFKMLRFKNEDEIIRQDTFLKLCFRELHFLPFKMKQNEWFKLVNQNLTNLCIIKIDKDADTSPLIRFNNLFFEFLVNRSLAHSKKQILAKRVYFDNEKEKYYFRNKDFVEYVYDIKNFRAFSSNEIHGMLRDLGVRNSVIRTEGGKQIRIAEIQKKKIDAELILSNGEDAFHVDFSEYEEEEQF